MTYIYVIRSPWAKAVIVMRLFVCPQVHLFSGAIGLQYLSLSKWTHQIAAQGLDLEVNFDFSHSFFFSSSLLQMYRALLWNTWPVVIC